MQHKSNKQHKPEKHDKLDVKHKPCFYVSSTAIAVFTTVLCTAAFAIDGIVSTGIKILSL
jgi:hypothetical protein